MAPQTVSKILQITSGHPYYTQLVCHCLFDLWSRAPKPVMGLADVEAVLAEAIELGSANLTYVWEASTPGEQAMMAGMAATMRGGTSPVTIDYARDAWRKVDVSLPEGEIARALRSLTSREVLAGTEAYSFKIMEINLRRMEKHLDWIGPEEVKILSQIALTIRTIQRARKAANAPESPGPYGPARRGRPAKAATEPRTVRPRRSSATGAGVHSRGNPAVR